jgi:hypothetical protein
VLQVGSSPDYLMAKQVPFPSHVSLSVRKFHMGHPCEVRFELSPTEKSVCGSLHPGSHPRQQFHMVGCFYKIFIFQLHAHCNKSKQHKTGSSRQRKVSPLSVGEIFPILLMHRVSLKGKLAAPFWSPHPWGYNLLPPACFLICKTG